MDDQLELEGMAYHILTRMVTNPTTTQCLDEDGIAAKAWRYADAFMAERKKRREVAEAMKELEK